MLQAVPDDVELLRPSAPRRDAMRPFARLEGPDVARVRRALRSTLARAANAEDAGARCPHRCAREGSFGFGQHLVLASPFLCTLPLLGGSLFDEPGFLKPTFSHMPRTEGCPDEARPPHCSACEAAARRRASVRTGALSGLLQRGHGSAGTCNPPVGTVASP